MWDCRLQSDGLPQSSHGVHGSSLSSNSRESRSWVGSERLTNHHHSVSDGILSYSDSLPDNTQEPRWTSPVQKFNLREVAASSMGGSRQTSRFPSLTERRFALKASAASPSFGSPSSLSESSHLESTSKPPIAFSNRNFPSRRSHMSKAVYPLVYRNPVSDCETFDDADNSSFGRLTPGGDLTSPSHWPDNSSSVEYKFHKTLTDLHKSETSPDPSASSRRDGFRWSSASSYDLGLDSDRLDVAEHVDVESLRSPSCSVSDQKCGVCGKFLWQKSPWSSHRIMRGGDMPIAGVLPCSHVFHAECLEQVTPKSQNQDPPCPLCLRTIGAIEESASVSEPLQVALRSLRGSRGLVISETQGSRSRNEASTHTKDRLRKNWLRVVPQRNRNHNGSSIANRLKRHFTFGGKAGKDIFSSKVFHKKGSSSGSESVQHQIFMQ
ncbi:uncharacterized protein LOC126672005 [Mercurialis annua]|uniref:uncharacterized protein LOC126672005 n=1 Tax=Mercurialis annua TaxID=3986 RepID=UPI0021607F67|nr:uncharacterized protein LOC126672005 [Mercurialis annua]XP_050221834.1 uncharacterized protein LOC126672005 [Mercurialis annua]XP_050221835.1 uncharacterized protein LOC126672005 [Mercurialis annua]XP_050221836.1 uncharacterized protein LOC126672005 [Mercurialis annua]